MPHATLLQNLKTLLDTAPPGPLRVGYSGGLDSTALLHALCTLPAARERELGAIHIDHALHPDSARWAEHCAQFCAALNLPLQIVRVQVDDIADLGLEGAARKARHAAFAMHLPTDGVLALAQHRDDQAETLLIRLLHGAGHEGLAGMRTLRPFGNGWLWRPLLDIGRDQLRAYATQHALTCIEDPSNADARHARNHLRHAVLPALATRWPDATRRIAAAAARMREESDLLRHVAQQALAAAQGVDPATLSLRRVRDMAPALRRLVIGQWLDALGLPRPPPGVWSRLAPDLLDARRDATPLLSWRGAELRRHRESLYALRPLPAVTVDWSLDWDGETALRLPHGFGTLVLEPATRIDAITVRPRRGGERIEQPGVRRELRTLLQHLGVPSWTRARLPLLVDKHGELLAVADLALSPHFAQVLAVTGARLRWLLNDQLRTD